jgi:hypothetical protein
MNQNDPQRGHPSRGWPRLRRDPGLALILALAAVLTLGLYTARERADSGVDRARLAAAVGID